MFLLFTFDWSGCVGAGGEAGAGAAAGRRTLDFEALAFAQGGHLMANKKCDLPKGSYRTAFKVRHSAAHPRSALCSALVCHCVVRVDLTPGRLVKDEVHILALGFRTCHDPRKQAHSRFPAGQGYDEVHVPALKPKPFAEDERLKEVSELPEWSRKAFAGMRSLNRIQSRVCNAALFSAENLLLCAPTGAGKTNVAMLTILHEVRCARGVRR